VSAISLLHGAQTSSATHTGLIRPRQAPARTPHAARGRISKITGWYVLTSHLSRSARALIHNASVLGGDATSTCSSRTTYRVRRAASGGASAGLAYMRLHDEDVPPRHTRVEVVRARLQARRSCCRERSSRSMARRRERAQVHITPGRPVESPPLMHSRIWMEGTDRDRDNICAVYSTMGIARGDTYDCSLSLSHKYTSCGCERERARTLNCDQARDVGRAATL
jgi:hypothetical protein